MQKKLLSFVNQTIGNGNMGEIIFWNIARSGGKRVGQLSADMICEDLAGLA